MADRYRYRTGGYVRILRTRNRLRDNAPMAFIEFVDCEGEIRDAIECDQWGSTMGDTALFWRRKMFKPTKEEIEQNEINGIETVLPKRLEGAFDDEYLKNVKYEDINYGKKKHVWGYKAHRKT